MSAYATPHSIMALTLERARVERTADAQRLYHAALTRYRDALPGNLPNVLEAVYLSRAPHSPECRLLHVIFGVGSNLHAAGECRAERAK